MPKKVAQKSFNIEKWYPRILVALALVGFIASFVLTIEKYEILKNPNHRLTCSINPLLSCGPIITSPEASAFGFPNPIIGLFAFSVLFAVGMTMLAGVTVKKDVRWYWRLYIFGHLFGLGFVFWLMREAIFELEALCIYCMVAWAVTFGLNWYKFLWMGATGRISLSQKLKAFHTWGLRNHWGVLLMSYVAVFAVIFFAFRSYFESVWF